MPDDPRRTVERVRALVDAAAVPGREGFDRLCDLCDAVVPAVAVSTATVSVLTDLGLMLVAHGGPDAGPALVDREVAAGEGPGIEACRRDRPVLVSDLLGGAEARWPGLAMGLDRDDVRAVFAFPLQVGAARLGVLEMTRPEPVALGADQTRTALAFAEVATEILLDVEADRGGIGPSDHASRAVGQRAEVYQAQGLVMVDLGVDLTEAMLRMRSYALTHRIDLDELALQILAGTVRLDAD
ncbi:GAF and ANTAR domain-containing protein [Solicola sp. PLA-1-18]|uniref:GAF and ANTAR domain-containing protein n=1 Tax=Solicola sp. PLA-1-18 TaxID=3380532 RepID=UPI003B7B1A1B